MTSVNETPDLPRRFCSDFGCQNTGSSDVNKDILDKSNYARNDVKATCVAAAKVNQRSCELGQRKGSCWVAGEVTTDLHCLLA